MTDPVEALLSRWRSDAEVLERHGRVDQAERLRARAAEVERAVRDRRGQELTVREAARESGYSEKRLRELVREGKLPGVSGDGGEVRIPRHALPRKPAADRDALSPVDRMADRLGARRR
jgi:excisionase family DNA binding protein